MKKLIGLVLLAVMVSGCAELTRLGIGPGTVVGGTSGALIGGGIGGTRGALIGGGVGTVTGAVWDHHNREPYPQGAASRGQFGPTSCEDMSSEGEREACQKALERGRREAEDRRVREEREAYRRRLSDAERFGRDLGRAGY